MPKPSWKLIVGEDGKVRTYAYSKRDMESDVKVYSRKMV